MKLLLLPFILLLNLTSSAQNINIDLKRQLDTILKSDQGIREFLDTEVKPARKDSLAKLLNYPRIELEQNSWLIMQRIDSLNIKKVEQLIAKYGYPGKSMVGEPENTAVFYVIQHSNKINKYYDLIEKAGKSGELLFRYAAMMLDRKLSGEGKEQIYGTQVFMKTVKNQKTGKMEPFEYVVPIKDPKNVNKRRKEAGFDSTVEANALRMGVVYKAYTLEEIKAITKTDK